MSVEPRAYLCVDAVAFQHFGEGDSAGFDGVDGLAGIVARVPERPALGVAFPAVPARVIGAVGVEALAAPAREGSVAGDGDPCEAACALVLDVTAGEVAGAVSVAENVFHCHFFSPMVA